jgi:DNA polymerase III subunit gamma/tau
MVFYRKYRPQTIEELDSKEVRDKLENVLKSDSLPHAFLFTGPKGLGKTSTARIVAKSLNCERLASSKLASSSKKEKLNAKRLTLNAGVEPCNICEQCKSITSGSNMDVLEIDGASNRGIDEIRDLREKVKLSSVGGRYKVYIIDEVHMLTTEAFNALLKTLEEPPAHVVFVLCTTEPHKVPSTILSRCLHVKFKKATEGELVRSFQRILKAEKLSADEDVLKIIASLSDGSFRDGVKILEELSIKAVDQKITKELIEDIYHSSSIDYKIAQIVKSLENKDAKSALSAVSELVEDGIDMGFFLKELTASLHSILLSKIEVEDNSQFAVRTSHFEVGELKTLIEILGKANGELKYAVLPQIPLELAIVEWCVIQKQVKPGQNRQSVSKPVEQLSGKVLQPTDQSVSKSTDIQEDKDIVSTTQQDIGKYDETDAFWKSLIDVVKKYNHSIAGVLRGCSMKDYNGESLTIQTKFKFHKEKLMEPRTQEALEKACREILKKDVKISVEMKDV